MITTTTEEHKMVEGKIDIKIVTIEAEAEVLVKKEQITKGLQNKIRKMTRTKNALHEWNQEINTRGKKNKHKFGKFNAPSKQQKNFADVVVIEPIRNEKTKERRQSQTVIVPDTQEADGDQQLNGKDGNNFLFHGQGATRTNQTNRQ